MRSGSFFSRFGLTWIIVLPVGLFIGVMIASAGVAIHPPVSAIANPLICDGTIDYQSQNYSYRPGQSGVQRYIYCVTNDGKEAREDVTLAAIGWSFLLYSAISFALLRLIVVPLIRRRFRDALAGTRARSAPGFGTASPAASAVDVQDILAQVSQALEQGRGNVVVRNMRFGTMDGPADDEDPAERLAQLKQLYESGLITAEDYESKKAEILSRL